MRELLDSSLVSGNSWCWDFADIGRDFDPSQFTLTLVFRGPGQKLDLVSTSDTGFVLSATPAQTKAMGPGLYGWALVVTSNDGNPSANPPLLPTTRVEISRGEVEILQDIAAAGDNYDPRSFVKKTLDALEAAYADLATHSMSEYSIPGSTGGRQIRYVSRDELERQLNRYRWLYKQEQIANGSLPADSNSIKVRFG